ncbi:hypothetical protein LEP1GSC124_0486 [Leptospira interrogans serovar Pyrogenes str. 200701872]|uniref:Uncharacterized protein n=1 Tax=Leptospira interrogans serovar Pyrogenes str. 200701872 TaxID=1193029 RepID=M6ZHM8_LEPIR|nr:hypothetical protein LEP1GSC124_0486 [Leptospira interrogans serovar Pyrogenes str. 200701872]
MGEKEMESNTLAVRMRGQEDTKILTRTGFISNLQDEIKSS